MPDPSSSPAGSRAAFWCRMRPRQHVLSLPVPPPPPIVVTPTGHCCHAEKILTGQPWWHMPVFPAPHNPPPTLRPSSGSFLLRAPWGPPPDEGRCSGDGQGLLGLLPRQHRRKQGFPGHPVTGAPAPWLHVRGPGSEICVVSPLPRPNPPLREPGPRARPATSFRTPSPRLETCPVSRPLFLVPVERGLGSAYSFQGRGRGVSLLLS